MSFEVGDVVRLKSGGPKMTVKHIRSNGDLDCVWFPAGSPQHQGGLFKPEMLEESDKTVGASSHGEYSGRRGPGNEHSWME